MTISQYDFWYDKQQVRILEQLVRAFSGFSYQTGIVNGQAPQTIMVPCRVATTNRMVANIMTNLSENALLTVPIITVSQTGLRGRKEDLQNPTFVDHRQVIERNIAAGVYGPSQGNSYSVDRIMPLPFIMEAQIDIWTSNMQQKYMLIEQILPVVYPQFEIQNSENALDWTAVTICLVDDDMTFSSRTIPTGTGEEIDVASLHLKIPIWLSAPAKVKAMRRIEEVVANVYQGQLNPATGYLDTGAQYKQVIVSPGDACVAVDGSSISLLGDKDCATLPDGSVPSWPNLFTQYGGSLEPTVSKIKLFLNDDIEGPFVTGSLQYSGNANTLLWTIDAQTLPANTLSPVDGVIDPLRSFPGSGLPTAANGQRYLLVNDIGNSVAWGTLSASVNDIIQFSNGVWTVSFDADMTTTTQFVLNAFSGRQLRWTGDSWMMAIDGVYQPGHWRLALTPAQVEILSDETDPPIIAGPLM